MFVPDISGACFEEAPCREGQSLKTHHFDSVESWSDFYSNKFSMGVGGGFKGFSGSISASLGSTTGSSGQESRRLDYAVQSAQRKCYRLIRDQACAYNQSNLQADFLERLESLPKEGNHTRDQLEAWREGFVQRFGTHIVVESSHGALVHALVSDQARSESSSACRDAGLCLEFAFVSTAHVNFCSNTSTCDARNQSSQSHTSSCVALGGDATLQNQICQPNATQETIDAWLEGGDLEAGSSAYHYSFMAIPEFLTNVDTKYHKAAETLQKAIEYSNCAVDEVPRAWRWDEESSTCKCARQCQNGGVLDEATCTCQCQGDVQHGWRGPSCEETYGSCQPGVGTGNSAAARRCPVRNECSSWYTQRQCKDTDVCCATDFGTTCCPFGSVCSCGVRECTCKAEG